MLDQEELYTVYTNMQKHGGSFVKVLGELIMRADHISQAKIKNTWPEYWDEYKTKEE